MRYIPIISVFIEALFIGFLFWRLRQAGEQFDESGKAHRLLSESYQLQADKHAELFRLVKIADGEAMSALNNLADTTMSQLNRLQATIYRDAGDIERRFNEAEAKVSDLSEGCERLDMELSTVVDDMRELSRLRGDESKEIGDRIKELAGEQEKIRRKATRPGSPNSAWDAVSRAAENNSKKRDPAHDKLVALAEGEESVQ